MLNSFKPPADYELFLNAKGNLQHSRSGCEVAALITIGTRNGKEFSTAFAPTLDGWRAFQTVSFTSGRRAIKLTSGLEIPVDFTAKRLSS